MTTAADILVDTLVDQWGVRHIFGLPGDGINGIMESLRRRKDDVQFILVRHEEAAAFAACGYAKFTGGLGVCLATSGPGAIHLLNGLYDAKMDGASVLALTGQTYHDLIGTFYQQDIATDRPRLRRKRRGVEWVMQRQRSPDQEPRHHRDRKPGERAATKPRRAA